MKRYLIVTVVMLGVTSIFADQTPSEQALQLAEVGVVGTNADGNAQTTFVDENGNLKMVPSVTVPKKTITKPLKPVQTGPQGQSVPVVIPGGTSIQDQQGPGLPPPVPEMTPGTASGTTPIMTTPGMTK